MEISYPDSNRIGKFNILYQVLEDGRERPMLEALFSLCRMPPLLEEENESGRGKTYYVASDLFQPLCEGEEIPEYRIELAWPDQAFKNPEHELDCLRSGGFRFRAVRQIIVRVPPLSVRADPRTPFH